MEDFSVYHAINALKIHLSLAYLKEGKAMRMRRHIDRQQFLALKRGLSVGFVPLPPPAFLMHIGDLAQHRPTFLGQSFAFLLAF